MKIIDSTAELSKIETGSVLTIGNFDSVHLGHQAIIAAAKKRAQKNSAGVTVLTFYPHPAVVLHPEKTLGVLTPLKLKLALLESLGVDTVVVLSDSYKLLNLSPKDFIDGFLMQHINLF